MAGNWRRAGASPAVLGGVRVAECAPLLTPSSRDTVVSFLKRPFKME